MREVPTLEEHRALLRQLAEQRQLAQSATRRADEAKQSANEERQRADEANQRADEAKQSADEERQLSQPKIPQSTSVPLPFHIE